MSVPTFLTPGEQFSDPVVARVPPLLSAVTWARQDPDVPAYEPAEVLTLVSDNHKINSFAWNLLSFLSVTDHPQASINTSQSCGTDVMLYSNGSGSPWAAGSHVEVHHGEDAYGGPSNPNAGGCTIAQNIEFSRRSPGGQVIGIELNAGASQLPPDVAVQLQGKFTRGVDLGPNDLHMQQGQRLWLSATSFLWVDAKGNLGFVKNGKAANLRARVRDWLKGVKHPTTAPESPSVTRPGRAALTADR